MDKQYKTVPLTDIHPYPHNPRINDAAAQDVAKSIKQCGYIAPIVVDENMVILAGHTRKLALESLGRTEADIIIVSGLSDAQKRKYRLLDNKTQESADWDFDLLEQELDGLDFDDLELDWGIDLDDEPTEAVEDDYDAEPPEEPRAKMGDIYQLGRHRLMCGDSTKREDVERLIDGTKIELVYTDPPYDMKMSGDKGFLEDGLKGLKKEIADITEFDPYSIKWLADFPCGSFYIWTSKNGVPKYFDMFKNAVKFNILTWVKTNPMPFVNNTFLADTEYCLYFGNKNSVWNNGLKPMDVYKRCYISKKDTKLEDGSTKHPTIKPVPMVVDKIRISSNRDGNVLDLFGGSGTTLIACEQLNRTCYMMEYEPRYIDVIIDRYEKFTNQKAVKIGS